LRGRGVKQATNSGKSCRSTSSANPPLESTPLAAKLVRHSFRPTLVAARVQSVVSDLEQRSNIPLERGSFLVCAGTSGRRDRRVISLEISSPSAIKPRPAFPDDGIPFLVADGFTSAESSQLLEIAIRAEKFTAARCSEGEKVARNGNFELSRNMCRVSWLPRADETLMRVIRAINFARALIHCVIRAVTVLNLRQLQINSLLPISEHRLESCNQLAIAMARRYRWRTLRG